jgi:hypothetical protein
MGLRRLPQDFHEVNVAMAPHMRAANEAQQRAIELLRELHDPAAELSADDRAARQAVIDELWAESRRASEAAQRASDEFKAKHPRWVTD